MGIFRFYYCNLGRDIVFLYPSGSHQILCPRPLGRNGRKKEENQMIIIVIGFAVVSVALYLAVERPACEKYFELDLEKRMGE